MRWCLDTEKQVTNGDTLTVCTQMIGNRFLASISVPFSDDPDPSPCGYTDSQEPGYDWKRAEYER